MKLGPVVLKGYVSMAPPFVPEPGSPVVATLGMNVVQLINLPVFLPRSPDFTYRRCFWVGDTFEYRGEDRVTLGEDAAYRIEH